MEVFALTMKEPRNLVALALVLSTAANVRSIFVTVKNVETVELV